MAALSVKLPTKLQTLEAEAAFVVLARAQELARQGKNIINLGIGQPDAIPAPHILSAAKQAIDQGKHGYTDAPGTQGCRCAVSNYIEAQYGVEIDSERIIIFPGGKVTMSFANLLLGEADNEVLIPDPGFPTYAVMARFSGAKVRTYGLDSSRGFSLVADEVIRQINDNTRLLVLNSPGNPTGGLNCRLEIAKLMEAIRDYPHLHVLSDEIYSRLSFDDNFDSLLCYPELQDRLIVLDGWSKTYAMTGWRLGWSVWPKHLVEPVTNLAIHMHSCVNVVAQAAAIAALEGDQSGVEAMKRRFDSRRKRVYQALNSIDGIHCALPAGAFYAFPDIGGLGIDGVTAQRELLEDFGVATIAGTSFGQQAKNNIRLSFAASDEKLDEALIRIKAWAAQKSGKAV